MIELPFALHMARMEGAETLMTLCREEALEAGNSSLVSAWNIELLLQINCTQSFVTYMNSSLDYSFINTTLTDAPISSSTTVVPRASQQNPKLPAYLDGQVVWGGRPAEVSLPKQDFSLLYCSSA